MDETHRNPYLPVRMRLLLALLALISGISAPQVVLAASPAEVAGQVLGAAETAEAEQACVLRAAPSRTHAALRRVRTIQLPLLALSDSDRGFSLSDRARE